MIQNVIPGKFWNNIPLGGKYTVKFWNNIPLWGKYTVKFWNNIPLWGKYTVKFWNNIPLWKKYKDNNEISPRRDLNSRPLVYKTSALTPELRKHVR